MSPAPVVFTGPSLAPTAAADLLPGARVEPPAARGDLDRLRAEGHVTFLILDGHFAHRLALPPGEIVAALNQGARVIGAASLGAIRAAECWPAGMEGTGAVYRLYRLRVIADDDEVAVATDPDRDFAALSVALINIRYASLAALRAGLLDRPRAAVLLATARRTHFAARHWRTLLSETGIESAELLALATATDIKRADAIRALARLAASAPHAERRVDQPAPRAPRTSGHDPYLGHPPATLREPLTTWLQRTGRHRRYGGGADQLWETLERTGALQGELLRWYAAHRQVESAGP